LRHRFLFSQRRQPRDILLVLVQGRLRLGQGAIGRRQPFLVGLVIQFEQRVAFLHLSAFGEQHLVHESLDPRAHVNIFRRIELADELDGSRGVGRGEIQHLNHWRRQDGRWLRATK